MPFPSDCHSELPQALSQQAPSGHPVGEFADAGFDSSTHVVNDVGVEADACHQHEVAIHPPAIANQATHRDALRAAFFQEFPRHAPGGRAGGFISMASTLAVPAGRIARGTRLCTIPSTTSLMVPSPPAATIKLAPASMCSRAMAPAGARTGSRGNRNVVAVLLQYRDRTVEEYGSRASEFAGPGVVYKDSVAI